MSYDDRLDSKYQKMYEDADKFTAWLEDMEEKLLEEYSEENPDFDPKDRVQYGKFLDYCQDEYERGSL